MLICFQYFSRFHKSYLPFPVPTDIIWGKQEKLLLYSLPVFEILFLKFIDDGSIPRNPSILCCSRQSTILFLLEMRKLMYREVK